VVIGEQGYSLMVVPNFVQILSYPKHPKPHHSSSLPPKTKQHFQPLMRIERDSHGKKLGIQCNSVW
jgi:hypothetical protein